MAEYWGVKAIAKRLGVARSTVMLWYERRGLLMLMRRRGPRDYWWTDENLLNQWLVAQCIAERQLRLDRKKQAPAAVAESVQ